ncbi:MAG TPA: hypothetical protein VLC95_01105 [Anaerolineae bacterium]|nr:hypothetical protein [Anaerolineae bacterium]
MEEERGADARRRVLELLGRGQIGVEEAERLLRGMAEPEEERLDDGTAAEAGFPSSVALPAEAAGTVPSGAPEGWRRFWIWPLLAGGVVLLAGALIMGLVYATAAAAGWLVCGWVPMIAGLLVMGVAWWSRTATWLHLRISEPGSRRIAISMPLPLTLAAWVLRIARPYVPQLRDTGVDELILALRDSRAGDAPLFIDVQDEEDGEHVQIYIG